VYSSLVDGDCIIAQKIFVVQKFFTCILYGINNRGKQMIDKELLEFAAKAIGLKLRYNYLGGRDANQPWDPLEDDGDALRLAVKLHISVWVDAWDACCSWVPDGQNPFTEGMQQLAQEITNGDPYAATRRAIVRAAAEIGKQNAGK
jgi:hypothetical protein